MTATQAGTIGVIGGTGNLRSRLNRRSRPASLVNHPNE